MLMKYKSDIFTRDFYTLPFFYTYSYYFNFSKLQNITALLDT